MSGEQPTWALLAPVARKRLATLAKEYWREEVGDDEDFKEEGWEIVDGTGDYSAILDRNPGSDATHDPELAQRISRKAKRPVFVLYLDEDYADTDAVAVYEGGKQTGARRAPYALARSLGITLPGDPAAKKKAGVREATSKKPVDDVLVVEGVSAAKVARAMDIDAGSRGPLHIEDGPVGAIVYNDETGGASTLLWSLSTAFPKSNVFALTTGPDEGRFLVEVMRGGTTVGTFDFPVPADPESGPVLDSIKGATTPQGIARALGIPAGLLDLKESK